MKTIATRARLPLVLLPLLLLAGCGGDNGGGVPIVGSNPPAPAPTPTPTPTPTPPPNYTGVYSGTLEFRVAGVPWGSFATHLDVSQNGDTLDLGVLEWPGVGDFPLKTATLINPTEFQGSAGYGSAGCGRVKVSTQGNFNGPLMHILVGLTSDCTQARFIGDLSR